VEQHAHWRPGRAGAPGYLEQCRQLTAARAAHPWLAAGSQAIFRCTACSFTCNADVNAARNIAARHAVTARGGYREAGPVNREPQLLASFRT
jgi:Putative transposase DNA-binding domain